MTSKSELITYRITKNYRLQSFTKNTNGPAFGQLPPQSCSLVPVDTVIWYKLLLHAGKNLIILILRLTLSQTAQVK